MASRTVRYSNGEITVVWEPELCAHTAICYTELPEVFKPEEQKWIDTKGASNEKIMKQCDRCPTGALTYFVNKEK